jgi:hypothetical protein
MQVVLLRGDSERLDSGQHRMIRALGHRPHLVPDEAAGVVHELATRNKAVRGFGAERVDNAAVPAGEAGPGADRARQPARLHAGKGRLRLPGKDLRGGATARGSPAACGLRREHAQSSPNSKVITMPATTPMANPTAKIRRQNRNICR